MKQIFVGSSSHAASESYGHIVRELIASLDPERVKPLYWREAFPLSIVTFDALERMLSICSGAVLVATPEIEGQPNENVMLEFGLVAGRMGITNVVLCKHPEARVPSDLGSLTYIELTPGTDGKAATLSPSALGLLQQWALGLPETMKGVPATRLVHGYTGRWNVNVNFDRWRKVPIIGSSIAVMEGKFDLNIPPDGKDGFGLSISKISVRIQQPDTEVIIFEAYYKACAKIFDVDCLPGGGIQLRSHTFSRQRLKISGTPPSEEGWSDEETGPWNFDWCISPDPDPTKGYFNVSVKTVSIEWTSGTGFMRPVGGLN